MSLRQQVEALLPAPQSYAYQSDDDFPDTRMPFVNGDWEKLNFWDVPKTDCYNTACVIGQEYAGHYLQYLKEQPSRHNNILGSIVKDMRAEGVNGGFAVGFLSYLERILSEWAQDQSIYDRLVQDRESDIKEMLALQETEKQEEMERQLQESYQHDSK